MKRHLVLAAVVLGVLVTAERATLLVSAIILVAKALRVGAVEPFTWWHVQLVVSAVVHVSWTALVSYVAVQVCRRMTTTTSADVIR